MPKEVSYAIETTVNTPTSEFNYSTPETTSVDTVVQDLLGANPDCTSMVMCIVLRKSRTITIDLDGIDDCVDEVYQNCFITGKTKGERS